ncbi:MAG: hypothetical protein Q7S58_12060 [Candidatus Binatus sp.]|uniref:hypothetical protein n=1 Tax=Candidatus Binatus sp. TaxID=2811406 RepID=UPI00271804A9|nr:hypothetical protein [Candidatus Binatus sp.]MDO8433134.1 hypothetical protein [Candidatus Binatus sp.]
MNSKRGAILTTMAVLLVLLGIEDILKPLRLEGPTTGLVFFGTRLSDTPNAILGPLLGVFLLIYASSIWQMRRSAITIAYIYAIYVTINLALYTMKYPTPPTRGEQIFGIVYSILALVLTWGTAILLSRRKADLT